MAVLALTAAPAWGGNTDLLVPGFDEEPIITGLDEPTQVAWLPDGRALVTEKPGRLILIAAGASTGAEILDISDEVNSYSDRGLLGVAVDSGYPTHPYIYIVYTHERGASSDGAGPMTSRLERFTLSPDGVLSQRTVLLGADDSTPTGTCAPPPDTGDCIPSDSETHSIGSVRSAPDGTLYVGSGDAAGFGTVDLDALRTYDETTMAGKIMRVDRNGLGLPGHPFCPGEPDLTKVCTKLHAKGFRNPFRFGLRPGGGLIVGDVGWGTSEELDIVTVPGRAYGWPCYEGTHWTVGYQELARCELEYAKEGSAAENVRPVWDYQHVATSPEASPTGAVIAGPQYAGDEYPSGMRGSIFVGDYAQGWIKRVTLGESGTPTVTPFAENWYGVDLEAAPDGDVVWVSYFSGTVERFTYRPGNSKPAASFTAAPGSGNPPLPVHFDASPSSDPDGDLLTYDWDFGDGAQATGKIVDHTFTTGGSRTVKLTISDGRGKTDTATKVIQVGRPPVVTVDSPATYRDGESVTLQGHAIDPDEGTLAGDKLRWKVILHHSSHQHQLLDQTGSSVSFTPLIDHDADSHYEIRLTGTDSTGLQTTVTRTIEPETTTVALRSEPAGAELGFAGVTVTAPADRTSAVGFHTSVSAPARRTVSGKLWWFDHWSDEGDRLHDITVPATAVTLTAVYREAAPPAPVIHEPGDDAIVLGRPIALRGGATDAEDGALGGAALRWKVELSRAGEPPAEVWSAEGPTASYTAPDDLDANAQLVLTLTATDSDGMSASASRSLHPKRVVLRLRSQPAGAPISHRGRPGYGADATEAAGARTTVAAGERFRSSGSEWVFDHWSDGGARGHELVMPDGDLTLTAVYREVPGDPGLAGPVLDLDFDEGRGRVAHDGSGNRNDGTLRSARWAKGRRGRAVVLDGRRSWVTVADSPELRLGRALSVEAWVRPDRVGRWSTVVAKEASNGLVYGLFASGPGAFDGPVATVGPLADAIRTPLRRRRWTHVAMTFDGLRLRTYVGGVLARVATADPFAGGQAGALRIGGNGIWKGEQFDGRIDEVRIWPRALTGAELAAHAGRAPAVRRPRTVQACAMRGAPRGLLGRGRLSCPVAAHRGR